MIYSCNRMLFASFLAAVLVLAGCSGSSGNNGGDTEDETTMDMTEEDGGEDTTDTDEDTSDATDTTDTTPDGDDTVEDVEDEDMEPPPPGCDAECVINDPPPGDLTCFGDDTDAICAVDCSNDPAIGNCNSFPEDGCEANLTDNITHCGACNNGCSDVMNGTAACNDGTCGYDCNEGWDDCDEVTGNGCEVDLNTDLMNCGACNNACEPDNAAGACNMGACEIDVCDMGFDDCNETYSDGCEQALNTLVHCGACNNACSVTNGTGDCSTGACEVVSCNQGFIDANDDASDGCETTISATAARNVTIETTNNNIVLGRVHFDYYIDGPVEAIVASYLEDAQIVGLDPGANLYYSEPTGISNLEPDVGGGPVSAFGRWIATENRRETNNPAEFGRLSAASYSEAGTQDLFRELLETETFENTVRSGAVNILLTATGLKVYSSRFVGGNSYGNSCFGGDPFEICELGSQFSTNTERSFATLSLVDTNSQILKAIISVSPGSVEVGLLDLGSTTWSFNVTGLAAATTADQNSLPATAAEMGKVVALPADGNTPAGFAIVSDDAVRVYRVTQPSADAAPTDFYLESEFTISPTVTVVDVESVDATKFLVATEDEVLIGHSSPNAPLSKLNTVINKTSSGDDEIEFYPPTGRLYVGHNVTTLRAYTLNIP